MVKPLATAPTNKPSDYIKYNKEKAPFWTTEADGKSQINYAETGYASKAVTPTMTVMELFIKAAKRRPNKIAMRTEAMPPLKKGESAPPALPLDQWTSWTWKKYHEEVRLAARALMKLGMKQFDSVNIFGFNSPEWFIGMYASMFAGGKAAGIYPTDTADQVQFKSFHSNASVAIVQDAVAFDKFAAVIDDLPYLKAIVCWAHKAKDITRSDGTIVKVLTFEKFLKLGESVKESHLDDRMARVKPNHCCALIYTSGTTGKPKAVMLSHDNMIFETMALLPMCEIGVKEAEERLISFLPLSHVAGMLVDALCPISTTASYKGWLSTNFARSYDLKTGTLGARLNAVQPTIFLGVPRVWEKIQEKLLAVGATTKGLKKKLSTTAKKKGLQASMNQQIGGNGKTPFMYGTYSKLLKLIKGKLGLSKCHFAFAGAAPMTRELLAYYGSLGINVNEVYGMSECTGAATWSLDKCHQWGSCGFELPGTEVKCLKQNSKGKYVEVDRCDDLFHPKESEQGEICFRGRHIMMGYLANPKLGEDHVNTIKDKNAEAIDSDGWLHSGDKGCISKLGMVRITGRYKELIIGAGGENIAPVPIEDNMKALCPFISNIMMIGDKRKFNVALITLKCEGASGELPGSNKLMSPANQFGKTIEDACKNKKFIDTVVKALKDTGNNGDVTPSNAAKVQKFTILPLDFSVQTGELTATLKLKRSVVNDKYVDIIDAMYDSKDVFVPYSTVGSYSVKSASDAQGSFKTGSPLDLSDSDVAAVKQEMKESL